MNAAITKKKRKWRKWKIECLLPSAPSSLKVKNGTDGSIPFSDGPRGHFWVMISHLPGLSPSTSEAPSLLEAAWGWSPGRGDLAGELQLNSPGGSEDLLV